MSTAPGNGRRRLLARALLSLTILLPSLPAGAAPEADKADDLIRQALAAVKRGELTEATALASRAITAEPKQSRPWAIRAQIYSLRRDYGKSESDWSRVLDLEPELAEAWQRRGEERFRAGKIDESIRDFDRYLELRPDQKPHHWQRGIALYYAGRFADGKRQFALHQTVNTQDVENAVWHFLCNTRAEGLPTAKRELIPIEGDPRVPMAEVHRLFAGKASPEDVLTAARAAPAKSRSGEPLFYAHLYLGIYFEAIGEPMRAREYINKAAARSDANDYMGDVARVHAELLKRKLPTKPSSRKAPGAK